MSLYAPPKRAHFKPGSLPADDRALAVTSPNPRPQRFKPKRSNLPASSAQSKPAVPSSLWCKAPLPGADCWSEHRDQGLLGELRAVGELDFVRASLCEELCHF